MPSGRRHLVGLTFLAGSTTLRLMQMVRTAVELRAALQGLGGAAPSFVPTMGALHAGHLRLVRRAAEVARPVVVSIFVNPTQFGPGEDFARYPRRLDEDVKVAAQAGAEIIFAPPVEEIYPEGAGRGSDPFSLPAVATQPGLEDAYRPGHFAGVCQVVARLFDLVQPAKAIFGEKDYQQLRVIEDLVLQQNALGDVAAIAAGGNPRDPRWPGLQIIRHPTVREAGGLAMSSRNVYLTAEQRERALGINRALDAANIALQEHAEREMRAVLEFHEVQIEYAVVRDARTLLPPSSTTAPLRALIAGRVGSVRLIDNVMINPSAA